MHSSSAVRESAAELLHMHACCSRLLLVVHAGSHSLKLAGMVPLSPRLLRSTSHTRVAMCAGEKQHVTRSQPARRQTEAAVNVGLHASRGAAYGACAARALTLRAGQGARP
jgi:hypothetical protein